LIGTTIRHVASITRPARSAPHRTRPKPNPAHSPVNTKASTTLPIGDQSNGPRTRLAPTVELTTINRTASPEISFCQCSSRNSPATFDQEIFGAIGAGAGLGAAFRSSCSSKNCTTRAALGAGFGQARSGNFAAASPAS